MKILMVSDYAYPNYMGGIPRLVYEVVSKLYKMDIDISLMTRLPFGRGYINIKDDFWTLLQELGHVLEFNKIQLFMPNKYVSSIKNADIVNIHHPIMGIYASLLAAFFKKKIIYNFYGPHNEEYFLITGKKGAVYFLYTYIQRMVMELSDTVLVLSDYSKKWALKIDPMCEKKIKYLPPFVDTENFHPCSKDTKELLRKKYNIPVDKKILITTRRLTKRTGVYELVKYFNEINSYFNNNLVLIVSGIGELEGEIKKYHSDCVKVLGFIKEEDLSNYYRLSDLYILPTLDQEGFGLVILEAFASGIPVIASISSGGGAEFLEKIDKKLLFDMNNLKSIISCIEYTLGNVDTKKYREIAEDYSLDNLASFYLELFKQL